MAYRILVVDDDRSIVKMIKDFLEMERMHFGKQKRIRI